MAALSALSRVNLALVLVTTCHVRPFLRLPHAGASSSQTQNSSSPPRPLPQPVSSTDTQRGIQRDPCVAPQAEGIRCEIHPPRCLRVNRMWDCSCTTQSMAGESTAMDKLRLLSMFPGFLFEIFIILDLKPAQAKAQWNRMLHSFQGSDSIVI